jgi:hypothetical protein
MDLAIDAYAFRVTLFNMYGPEFSACWPIQQNSVYQLKPPI